ncbi:hypothetical protein D3C84_1007120 [compost metagenome]
MCCASIRPRFTIASSQALIVLFQRRRVVSERPSSSQWLKSYQIAGSTGVERLPSPLGLGNAQAMAAKRVKRSSAGETISGRRRCSDAALDSVLDE